MLCFYENYGVRKKIYRAFQKVKKLLFEQQIDLNSDLKQILVSELKEILIEKKYPDAEIKKRISQLTEMIEESFWHKESTSTILSDRDKNMIVSLFREELKEIKPSLTEAEKFKQKIETKKFISEYCLIEQKAIKDIKEEIARIQKKNLTSLRPIELGIYNNALGQEFLFIITKLKYQKNIDDIESTLNVLKTEFPNSYFEIDSEFFEKYEHKRDELANLLNANCVPHREHGDIRRFLIKAFNLKNEGIKERMFLDGLPYGYNEAIKFQDSVWESIKKARRRAALYFLTPLIVIFFLTVFGVISEDE